MSHSTDQPRNQQGAQSSAYADALSYFELIRQLEEIFSGKIRILLYAVALCSMPLAMFTYAIEGTSANFFAWVITLVAAYSPLVMHRYLKQRALDNLQVAQRLPKPSIRNHEKEHRFYIELAWHLPERSGGYVYVVQDSSISGYYKIGRTVDPKHRMLDFGVKLPFRISIVPIVAAYNSTTLEREMHERYADQRVNGEWFDLTESQLRDLINVLDYKAAYDIKERSE